MSEPKYDRGLSEALALCLEHLRSPAASTDPSAVVRMGTIQLDDGELAEIQLFVTADADIFVKGQGHES